MIRSIIFDLDGTIADTEPLHFEAFRQALAAESIELDRDDYYARLIGYADRECFEVVLSERGGHASPELVQVLSERKAVHYQNAIAQLDLLYPSADAFVRRCAQRFPLALVTGTLRAEAETILTRAGLRQLFTTVVAAEDVARSKPAPDGFLCAFDHLRSLCRWEPELQRAQCLVIEDTRAGIEAARQAGMLVLAVAQTCDARELAAADLVVPALAATDLDKVLSHF